MPTNLLEGYKGGPYQDRSVRKNLLQGIDMNKAMIPNVVPYNPEPVVNPDPMGGSLSGLPKALVGGVDYAAGLGTGILGWLLGKGAGGITRGALKTGDLFSQGEGFLPKINDPNARAQKISAQGQVMEDAVGQLVSQPPGSIEQFAKEKAPSVFGEPGEPGAGEVLGEATGKAIEKGVEFVQEKAFPSIPLFDIPKVSELAKTNPNEAWLLGLTEELITFGLLAKGAKANARRLKRKAGRWNAKDYADAEEIRRAAKTGKESGEGPQRLLEAPDEILDAEFTVNETVPLLKAHKRLPQLPEPQKKLPSPKSPGTETGRGLDLAPSGSPKRPTKVYPRSIKAAQKRLSDNFVYQTSVDIGDGLIQHEFRFTEGKADGANFSVITKERISYKDIAEAGQKILDQRVDVPSVQKLNKEEVVPIEEPIERTPDKIGKTTVTVQDISPDEVKVRIAEMMPEIRNFIDNGVGDGVAIRNSINDALDGMDVGMVKSETPGADVTFHAELLMGEINKRLPKPGEEVLRAEEARTAAKEVSTEERVEGGEGRQVRVRELEEDRVEAQERGEVAKIENTLRSTWKERHELLKGKFEDRIKATEELWTDVEKNDNTIDNANKLIDKPEEPTSSAFDDMYESSDVVPVSPPLEKMKTIETEFTLDKTNLLPTLLKDIANQNPSRTMIYELMQNSLDAFGDKSGKVDIYWSPGQFVEGRYFSKEEGTGSTLKFEDDGRGMTPEEVEKFFLVGGSIGKTGTTTRGGYGLAKIPLLLIPESIKLTTTRNGVRSIVETNREAIMEGFIEIKPERVDPNTPNGTIFEANLPEKIYNTTMDDWDIRNAVEQVMKGTWADAKITFQKGMPQTEYNEEGIEVFDEHSWRIAEQKSPTLLKDAEKKVGSVSMSLNGSDFAIHFLQTDRYGYKVFGGEAYRVSGMVTNKGLVVDIDMERVADIKMPAKPDFKFVIDFEKTPNVRDPRYPFLKNRTQLAKEFIKKIEPEIVRVVREMSDQEVVKRGAEFAAMIERSPEYAQGVKVLIPFEGKAFDEAKSIADANEDVIGDFSLITGDFTDILKDVGETGVEFHLTVDPKVYGFKSNPNLTGSELYAINPFTLTEQFTKRTAFQQAINAGLDLRKLQAEVMSHTMIHEYSHLAEKGHTEHFAHELMRVSAIIGADNVAVIAKDLRRFYEKYGDRLEGIGEDFENIQTGGAGLEANFEGLPVREITEKRKKSVRGVEEGAGDRGVEDFYEPSREEGWNDTNDSLDTYGIRDAAKDLYDLAKDLLRNEDGSISFGDLSPEQIARIDRLYRKAKKTGQDFAEFLRAAKYDEVMIKDVVEFAEKHLDIKTIAQPDPRAKRIEIDDDAILFQETRTLKARGYRKVDVEITMPPYYGSYYKGWVGSKDMKIGGIRRFPATKYVNEYTLPYHRMFNRGPEFLQTELRDFYNAQRRDEGIHHGTLEAELKYLTSKIPRTQRKKSYQRIYDHAIGQQEGGDLLLAANNRIKPKLTPEETTLYETMRMRMEELFPMVMKARMQSGKNPSKQVDNYFTFARAMGEMGVATDTRPLALDDAHAINQQYDKVKSVPFKYDKREVKEPEYKLKDDAVAIYKEYIRRTLKTIYISPVVARAHTILSPVRLSGSKGVKVFDPRFDRPTTFRNVNRWAWDISGIPPQNDLVHFRAGISALQSRVASAILLGNFRTGLIQLTAIRNAMIKSTSADFLKAIAVTSTRRGKREAINRSNHLLVRNFEAVMEDAFGSLKDMKLRDLYLPDNFQEFKKALGKGISIPDSWAARVAWWTKIAELERKGITGEQAAVEADNFTIDTQASGDVGHRSPLQNRAWGKVFSTFQTFVINDWRFLLEDVMGVGKNQPLGDTMTRLFKLFLYTAGMSYVMEDVLKIKSPFPRPVKVGWEGINEGAPYYDIAADVAKEFLEPIPFFSAIRYGKPITGVIMEKINDLTTGGKYGVNSYQELVAAMKKKKLPVNSFNTIATLLGVPGTAQMVKSYRAYKRGEIPWNVFWGNFSGHVGKGAYVPRSRSRSSRTRSRSRSR